MKCAHIWTPLIGEACVEGMPAMGLSASQDELAYGTAGTTVCKSDLGWTRVCRQSMWDGRDSHIGCLQSNGWCLSVCIVSSPGYFIQCLSTYCVSFGLIILCFVSLNHR